MKALIRHACNHAGQTATHHFVIPSPLPSKPTITCLICLDVILDARKTVKCAEQHTTCIPCFEAHVRALSADDVGLDDLLSRNAMIWCCMRPQGCTSGPCSDQYVAQHVSAQAFEAYMRSKRRLMEFQIRQEVRLLFHSSFFISPSLFLNSCHFLTFSTLDDDRAPPQLRQFRRTLLCHCCATFSSSRV